MPETEGSIQITVNMTPEEAWAFLRDLADETSGFRAAFAEDPQAALDQYGIAVTPDLVEGMRLPSRKQLEDLARISAPDLDFDAGRPPPMGPTFPTCLCLAVAFAAATRARDAAAAESA